MGSDRGYRFADWVVASDLPLPDLRSTPATPDWQVRHEPVTLRGRHAAWYHRSMAQDGRPWVWFGRDHGDDVLRFPGRAWCRIRGASHEISYAWQRDLDPAMQQHLLVNHVLPLAASHAGFMVFHASVVQRPSGGAVAILGPAGTGKSTTAAYLGAHGWPILSDDRLILDSRFVARPVAPYVRLSPEVAARLKFEAPLPPGHHKVRVPLSDSGHTMTWAPAGVRLERIVVLERTAGALEIRRVTGRDAMLAVLTAQLQLGLDLPDVRRRVFEGVSALVDAVRCDRLRMPADWASLPSAHRLLHDAP